MELDLDGGEKGEEEELCALLSASLPQNLVPVQPLPNTNTDESANAIAKLPILRAAEQSPRGRSIRSTDAGILRELPGKVDVPSSTSSPPWLKKRSEQAHPS
ncbi:MAG TPA: hypothetical protein VG097_05310 [Gemmata sp.]|nr:hypothetical protein [Gemmata sp.]